MIEEGTIIHGTMRECDLIPAFMSVLEAEAPQRVAAIVAEYGQSFIDRCCQDGGLDYSLIGEVDRQDYLLGDLWDAMENIAPEGLCFGAHPGDGSDYGFWSVDEE